MVLRSKSPDLVPQEIWGHLCCHYAIRSLMAEAADHAGHDPDRQLRRRATDRPGHHRPRGRFSPLTRQLNVPGCSSCDDFSTGSTRPAATAPHRE